MSLLTLFVFLCNQAGWSNPLSLPPGLGNITQEFNLSTSDPLPKVIHIQTVHMNYKVQKNIEKILEYLKREAGVDLVALEGADVSIDPDRVFHIDDMETRYQIADFMAQNGQITGSELFAVKSVQDIRDRTLKIEGVEDRKLYQENLSDLRYVVSNRKSMLEHLHGLRKRAENLESLILPREVQQILQHKRQFETQTENLPQFFHFLDEKAVTIGIEATPEKYPALAKFFILENISTFVDKNELAVLEEWKSFKTEHALNESASMSNELPGREIDRFAFPMLGVYKSYLELMSEAHEFSNAAMEEAERLENEILYTLILKKREFALVELEKDLADIKQLFDITLVRDRLGRIEKRAANLTYAQLVERLESMETSLARPVAPRISDSDRVKFDALMKRSISFYTLAKERDAVMVNRFEALLRTSKRAVIITGGFHSDGITQLLKQRGISYSVILPDVEEISDHDTYLNAFSTAPTNDINGSAETSHLEPGLALGNPELDPSSIISKLIYLFAAEVRTGQAIRLDSTKLGPFPEGISTVTTSQENVGEVQITRFVVTPINERPIEFTWSEDGLTLATANTTLSIGTVASIISENTGFAKEIDFGLIAPENSSLALALRAMIWVISAGHASIQSETTFEFTVPQTEAVLPTTTATAITDQANPLFELNPRLAAAVTLLNNEEDADETTVRGVIQTYVDSGGVAARLSAEVLNDDVPIHEISETSGDFAVSSGFGVLPLLTFGVPIIEKALQQKVPQAKIGTLKLVSAGEFAGFGISSTARLLEVGGTNFHVEKEPDGLFTVTGTPDSLLELRTRTRAGAEGIAGRVRPTVERLQSGLSPVSRVSLVPEHVRFADISALMKTDLIQAGALLADNFLSEPQKGSEGNFAVKVVTDLSAENFRQLELDIRENPSSIYIYLDYELKSDPAQVLQEMAADDKYKNNFFYLRVDDGRRNTAGAAQYLTEFLTQNLFTHKSKEREQALINLLLERSPFKTSSEILKETFIVGSTELISALNQHGSMQETPKLILDRIGKTAEEIAALHFVGLYFARLGFATALKQEWLEAADDAVTYSTYRPKASFLNNLSAVYSSYVTALRTLSISA